MDTRKVSVSRRIGTLLVLVVVGWFLGNVGAIERASADCAALDNVGLEVVEVDVPTDDVAIWSEPEPLYLNGQAFSVAGGRWFLDFEGEQ